MFLSETSFTQDSGTELGIDIRPINQLHMQHIRTGFSFAILFLLCIYAKLQYETEVIVTQEVSFRVIYTYHESP